MSRIDFDPDEHSPAECIEHFVDELQEGEEMPGHQPEEAFGGDVEEVSGEEEVSSSSELSFVPTEAEKDFKTRLATAVGTLPRPAAPWPKSSKGVKRPRSPAPGILNDDVVPDLAEIFDNYDTPMKQRVSICRAYASYLSSMVPRDQKKPKAVKKKSKK